MANSKSALKRARQTIKRTARNKSIRSALRTQLRKARETITSQDPAAIDAELKKAVSALAKAATKGVLHPNSVSRRVARLSAAAHAAKTAAAAQA